MSRSANLNQLRNMLNRIATAGGGFALSALVLNNSLYTVDGGEKCVMYSRFAGILPETTGEGTHFLLPFFQVPYILDIRTRPKTISSVTGTKDLQMVNIQLRVLSKPDVRSLPKIFQMYGADWEERILPSIGSEVLKTVVAQYPAEQLLTRREQVSKAVREMLEERAEEFSIILDDVAITHLSFGTEFTKAVEAKQVALQEAERSKFLVLKSEKEAEAAIIRAEGESEAAKLISEATRKAGNALLELRRIEAAKEIAQTISRNQNVSYLPGNGNVLLGVNRP